MRKLSETQNVQDLRKPTAGLTFFWPSSMACKVLKSSLVRYLRFFTSSFISGGIAVTFSDPASGFGPGQGNSGPL